MMNHMSLMNQTQILKPKVESGLAGRVIDAEPKRSNVPELSHAPHA